MRVITIPWDVTTLTDFVSVSQHGGGVAMDTTVKRSGTASLKCDVSLSGASYQWAGFEVVPSGDNTPRYMRNYMRVTTRPNVATTIGYIGAGSNITVLDQAWIKHNTNGTLSLFSFDDLVTPIGTSAAIPLNDYEHYWEMFIDPSPAAGSRVLTARLDGTVFATSNTRTFQAGGTRFFATGANLRNDGATSGLWHFDDGAINDNTGAFQTSWPGACAGTFALWPSGAGSLAQMTRGGVNSGANFSQVNENPPNTTNWVESAVLNQEDSYAMADLPGSVLAGATFAVLHGNVYAAGADAVDANNSEFAPRLKLNGVTTEGAAIRIGGTTYLRTRTGLVLPVLTVNGAGVTTAHVNGAEAGQIIKVANAAAARISSIWMSGEIATNVAPPSTSPSTLLLLGV